VRLVKVNLAFIIIIFLNDELLLLLLLLLLLYTSSIIITSFVEKKSKMNSVEWRTFAEGKLTEIAGVFDPRLGVHCDFLSDLVEAQRARKFVTSVVFYLRNRCNAIIIIIIILGSTGPDLGGVQGAMAPAPHQ